MRKRLEELCVLQKERLGQLAGFLVAFFLFRRQLGVPAEILKKTFYQLCVSIDGRFGMREERNEKLVHFPLQFQLQLADAAPLGRIVRHVVKVAHFLGRGSKSRKLRVAPTGGPARKGIQSGLHFRVQVNAQAKGIFLFRGWLNVKRTRRGLVDGGIDGLAQKEIFGLQLGVQVVQALEGAIDFGNGGFQGNSLASGVF